MGGLAKGVGGLLGFGGGGGGRNINITPARQLSTPGLQLDLQRGFLTRSGPQRALVVRGERDALESLVQNQGDIRALQPNIAPLRAQLGPLQEQGRGLFDRTSPLFGRLSNQLDELRPGFGRLTEARVGAVRNAASKAVGNVRSAFQQRDVLGSNFAQREIASIGNEFGRQEAEERATAFIQEQEAQRNIIGQIAQLVATDQANIAANIGLLGAELGLTSAESSLLSQEIANISAQTDLLRTRAARELTELSIAAGAVQGITGLAANIQAANASLAANAAAQSSAGLGGALQGLGSFFGFGAGTTAFGQLGTGAGGLFGGISNNFVEA